MVQDVVTMVQLNRAELPCSEGKVRHADDATGVPRPGQRRWTMPRMGEQTRQERRQEWIEAAWRCIAQKGYRSLTVDDICNEAGLSKGSFYTHFNQKQHLLLAML